MTSKRVRQCDILAFFFMNIVIFMGWWIPIYDILCSKFASLACLGWESGS